MPEARVEERTRIDRMPYDRWARNGALLATPGNVVDYAFVKAQIEADAELFDIGAIGVDPFNAVQLTTELQADGFDAIFFRQGFLSMSPPSKEIERLVVKRQLDHGGHPVLRMCAENVAVTRDPAGNIKPAKDKSTGRIDGVVATINALGVALAAPDAGPSVYETRGLLTVGG
jgi:phage terminase large subunit-like protein